MHIIKLFLISLIILCNSALAEGSQIKIKTNFGSIFLELYPNKAPKTVENFLSYAKEGAYTETIFHRIISGFMIQGGGFDKLMKKRPTKQPIKNEANNGLKNEIGTIAMARTGEPHSATNQFFINVSNNKFLNYTMPNRRGYGYTVFGKVIHGMNIVNKISKLPTGASKPFKRDVPKKMVIIESISIIDSIPAEIK
ncbi:MAG: cyclophilin [Nitrosomonadaceae bacterium]|nr:cyclophilin [Nitrosomonadaceae bacterium]|tara:strand:- start:548 stop:1135 length:588 start_codon:yes stop_codon:yes gene_type:complete